MVASEVAITDGVDPRDYRNIPIQYLSSLLLSKFSLNHFEMTQ